MRKLLIFLIVVGVLFLCIAPFTLISQLQRFLPQVYDTLTHLGNQQPSIEPKLCISLKENSSHWINKDTSNSAELICQVAYSVSNVGSGTAENIEVTMKINDEPTNTIYVASLQPSETYSNSLTVNAINNSARIVTVEAATSQSSAAKTLIVNANIKRTFDEHLCRFFVTPEDKAIVELKNQILHDKTVLTLDWMALRDWVGSNIQYKSDLEIHGERDFWQFPNETIPLGTGDCEDFSLLLCSLLRADGWSPDSVYVVVGEQNNQYHAWVRVTWNDLQYNIEPQGNGFAIAMGDILSLSGYNAKYYFNDQNSGIFQ